MGEIISISLVLIVLTVFIARRIIKLPSRYERHPKNLSPWSALDEGIDPTLPPGSIS